MDEKEEEEDEQEEIALRAVVRNIYTDCRGEGREGRGLEGSP